MKSSGKIYFFLRTIFSENIHPCHQFPTPRLLSSQPMKQKSTKRNTFSQNMKQKGENIYYDEIDLIQFYNVEYIKKACKMFKC